LPFEDQEPPRAERLRSGGGFVTGLQTDFE
jgi:hypothetical protein